MVQWLSLLHNFIQQSLSRFCASSNPTHGVSENAMVRICNNAQPASNIPGIFAECSLNVAMFQTSREHLGNIFKENIFYQILNGKVIFVLKINDLTKINVDLLANSSNQKAMFHEYSKNIPRISVSKIFQGYPRNIVRL